MGSPIFIAFDEVNIKLKEVFPRLFEGGSARLVLTEPDNPLETGIEFLIHPPGKKLTRMSLLSGGEKALSAIALIFSIFLIKPATFCLMDEIDASLDEINIFRFNDLLQIIGEKSQIIMITHNKKSMEFADTLFGITMEKKGVSKIVSVNLHPKEDDRKMGNEDKTQDLEMVLISPLCQSFQEKFLAEAEKIPGLKIITGAPESVERAQDVKLLTLKYSENGKQKQETFDLIVILTKPKISPELKSLGKKFQQDIL